MSKDLSREHLHLRLWQCWIRPRQSSDQVLYEVLDEQREAKCITPILV